MIRHPVLRDLARASKTHKFGPIALETRQGAILAGTTVVYSLLCYYAAEWIGFSGNRTALAFIWVLPLAVFFAFYKKEGRHADWWLEKKWLNAVRPKVLKFKRRDPDRPDKKMQDSIQEALPTESFYWEMLRCKDGTYLLAFEVEPVSLSMVGDTERGRVFAAACEFYNRIDFPIVEMTRSKEGSTARYTRHLRGVISRNIDFDESDLAWYADEHLAWLEKAASSYSIFERKGYVILPYNPEEDGGVREAVTFRTIIADGLKNLGLGGRSKPSKKDARGRQLEAEQAYAVLSIRAQVAYDGFRQMGCHIRLLKRSELLAFVKGQVSEFDEDSEEMVNPFEPVTLEPGGYELLPEHRRQQMIQAAEAVREDAPPALGIGDLDVADKVAPDAVRIYPDYIRAEGRYHTTLFVSDWADEVLFGMLEGLTHIEGRVKVLKYVTPRDSEHAKKILGSRLVQMRAAMRTADDGDIRSSQEREISMFTTEQAMAELTSGSQKYLEIALLVHCEAETEEGLDSLVSQVKTTLATYRTEAKLAREEGWEGFLSSLGLGNYLSERYVSKGMLTHPLSCLFSYSTHQINHEYGAFLGVDTRSGAIMTLDNRQLQNPHMVIIGQSGGGKSFVLKCLTTRWRMLGHRVVIVDPEGNSKYARVVKRLGGQFVMIAPGSPHKINPFDLHDDYMNIALIDDALMDDDADALGQAKGSALDGKAQELTRMVSLMITSEGGSSGVLGGLSGSEAAYVERGIFEAYRRKGITKNPATHDNEPPTFADFFAVLGEHAAGNAEVERLMEKLYSWHSGALSTMFDQQTNVDLANKYLCFQVSKVTEQQKAPVMHAILEFMNGILSNPDEPSDCVIDEAWSVLAYPMSAKFCVTMSRSGRARDNAMVFASQNPVEFIGSDEGKVILDLATTQMIFRHQHKRAAEATASIYDFSEEETKGLLNLQAGNGYLMVDQNRVMMQVLASSYEEALYNTDPKKEQWAREFLAQYEAARGAAKGAAKGGASDTEQYAEEVQALPTAAEALGDLHDATDPAGKARNGHARSVDEATVEIPSRQIDRDAEPSHRPAARYEPEDAPTTEIPTTELATGKPADSTADAHADHVPEEDSVDEASLDEDTAVGDEAEAGESTYGGAAEEPSLISGILAGDRPMRVYAFYGDEPRAAADTAAAVAELLGRETSATGLYIAAVDACDGQLAERLAEGEALPPDELRRWRSPREPPLPGASLPRRGRSPEQPLRRLLDLQRSLPLHVETRMERRMP